MECCEDGCPSGRFSHLHRVTLELAVRVTIGCLVTPLTKTLLPRLHSLAGQPALGSVFLVPNFIHLRMMETTVFFGTFNAAERFWYPSLDLCIDTILSELYGQFLRPHGLVFALTCTVNRGTLKLISLSCFVNNLHRIFGQSVCLSKSCPIN